MKVVTKIVPVFMLILLVPLTSYGQQEVSSLEINMKYPGGDRADYHGTALKIYQDNAKNPFKTMESLSGNPFNIPLPIGHRYKIEVYVNSMFANVDYVDLQNGNEKLQLNMPTPGSIRLTAVYNDGDTPIDNATVMIKSDDGAYEYWTNSTTDNDGNTIRFWLQPTIFNDDHYVASVLIGNDLSYNYYPIRILPNVSQDIKIITPWPAEMPPLVVSVYKSPYQKISKSDGNFVVQAYNSKENRTAESKVNVVGEAYFSSLKVGSYIFRAIDLNDDKNVEWGTAKMIIDGKQTSVQIFENQINNVNVALYPRIYNATALAQNEPMHQIMTSADPVPVQDLPLKQFKAGTLARDVKCNDAFILVLKTENGMPACVKSDTITTLLERGWISIHDLTTIQMTIDFWCEKEHPPSQFVHLCPLPTRPT